MSGGHPPRISHHDARHHLQAGNTLLAQGRLREAEDAYRQALRIDPSLAEIQVNLGVALKAQGRIAEAEAAYRAALLLRPDFVEAHNNLANILRQQGRLAEAETGYRRAIRLRPRHLEALVNLSYILIEQGQLVEAETFCNEALELRPDLAEAHNAMGLLHKAAGRSADALSCFARALQLKPHYAEADNNLANLHRQSGRPDLAEAAYRRALASRPNYAEAHNNLGNVLLEQGRPQEAEAAYRNAIALRPDYVEAIGHLGAALTAQGRLAEAAASYRHALERRPGYVVALNNLAQLHLTEGDACGALPLILQALQIDNAAESRLLFMDCITRLRIAHIDGTVRNTMIRALTEKWGQANSLARVGPEMVKLALRQAGLSCFADPASGRSGKSAPHEYSFGPAELAAAAADTLLGALLTGAALRDLELEQFLTKARRYLLEQALSATPANPADDATLRFHAALAQQCFINEYVFAVADDEAAAIDTLRHRLEVALAADQPVVSASVLTAAAYAPLHTLAGAERLPGRPWPEAVGRVLIQQIGEPASERTLAAAMPSLTEVDDPVSLKVRAQYLENPYPRWISADIVAAPRSIEQLLHERFPGVAFAPLNKPGTLDVLVAGCGTGHHPIGVARRLRNARVLAIDLSRASLAYAQRKTKEMGLSNIDYAQADILKLGKLRRTFDVIESSGVLHHLEHPAQGLKNLLALLRPGGFLALGLYSSIARRDITLARAYIKKHGYPATADGIRRCRQDLLHREDTAPLRPVTQLGDFYSTSTCRDLLFHVQETCITLPELLQLLAEHGLNFLGFDIDPAVRFAYRRRFPDDPACTDLAHWHRFEQEHPQTFIAMYQFWMQKPD